MSIASYTFLPWFRRGVSNLLQPGAGASANSVRATLTATLTVASSARQAETPPMTMMLLGPGDITGVEARQVIRTEPRAGTPAFENNYLAAIDFYDEDFPWRYTPSPPDSATHRLPPWLVLIVLEESEFSRADGAGPLGALNLTQGANRADIFPVVGREWAWAHVHLNHKLGGSAAAPDLNELQALLTADPDLAYSRLLCPRQLQPNRSYTAFLLPAFETGRKAGLGLPVAEDENGTTRSWEGTETLFPIYYEWTFQTGGGGDFETLVRSMVPRDVDPAVGVRDMDVTHPGFGLQDVTNPPAGLVGLEGALLAPTSVRRGLAATSNFVSKVQPILNSPADARDQGEEDPVVAPPIYGCWHAHVDRVNAPGADAAWVNQLNLDPRYRAGAGLGARVIRTHQDEYLRSAWAQIGDVLGVNRKIRRAQLAIKAASAVFSKSVASLPPERSIALLSPVLDKVRGGSVTLAATVRASVASRAAVSLSMVKQLRPRGRIARALFPVETRRGAIAKTVSGVAKGTLSPAGPRPAAGEVTVEGVSQAVMQRTGARAVPRGRAGRPTLVQLGEVVKLLSRPSRGPSSIASVRARPDFRFTGRPTDFTLPAGTRPTRGQIEPGDSPAAADMRSALTAFQGVLVTTVEPAPPKPPLDVSPLHEQLVTAVEPQAAFSTRFGRLLRFGVKDALTYTQDRYATQTGSEGTWPEVMAYPDIKEPMSRPLAQLSNEYLLPNLKLIPNNTISFLKTNQAFIESYMVGLNHEFARELLWQEFPTDQQGSYFRQFWDVSSTVDREDRNSATLAEALKDVPELHRWDRTSALGSHNHRGSNSPDGPIVLVLRGDLLKRYPNTFIYAQKAAWGTGAQANRLVVSDPTGELFESSPQDPRLLFPLYKATVEPDIYLIGFDLSLDEIRGDPRLEETATARAVCGDKLGWFFVLQQAVGEPRFGLDTAPPVDPSPLVWDNLSWADLGVAVGGRIDVTTPFVSQPGGTSDGGLVWGSNAADMGSILYQQPVMVAVHGREMLKNLNPGS